MTQTLYRRFAHYRLCTKTMDYVADDVIWMSFDGDLDRLACFLRGGDNNFFLPNGGRMAALAVQQVVYPVQPR